MEQAWLDSLSEDWVSQSPSTSPPNLSAPSLSTSTTDNSLISDTQSSQIQKHRPQNPSLVIVQETKNSPLSERNSNELNIPLSQRASHPPSKLRENSANTRGRKTSRTLSASTIISTECHTVQHKSHSVSPRKLINETPEWRRRLLNGDVAYGEQRDLFGPTGLEAIFKQPSPQAPPPHKFEALASEEDSIMPSSPPLYPSNLAQNDLPNTKFTHQAMIEKTQTHQPQTIQYKLADNSNSDFSVNDMSQSSNFRPPKSVHQDQHLSSTSPRSITETSTHEKTYETRHHISSQNDIRNEELSPIYIPRHKIPDEKTDLTPQEDPLATSHSPRPENIQNSFSIEQREMPIHVLDDRFVNFRRGGYSLDGSFRNRMLSPSSPSHIGDSILIPEESMQASTPKQLPVIKKTRESVEYQNTSAESDSPKLPVAPHPSPIKENTRSPLKLFGNYDTFTNQKLLRRLSQFEEHYEDGSQMNEQDSQSQSIETNIDEAHASPNGPKKSGSKIRHINHKSSRKMSSFGQGDLDNFQFNEASSDQDLSGPSQNEDNANVALPALDPSTQKIFHFRLDASPQIEERHVSRVVRYNNTTDTVTQTVTIEKTVESTHVLSGDSQNQTTAQQPNTPTKANGKSQVKRLPKSPLKDHTPKRRRTLRIDEFADLTSTRVGDDPRSLNEQQHNQTVAGKKRKDARQGDNQQAANPKVLAMRQILRPRSPTPSQRSSQQRLRTPSVEAEFHAIERSRQAQEKKIAKIQAELDSVIPSTPLASKPQVQSESRKGSVTTQDFIDEARKIMAGIRGKIEGKNGLTSLEESEAEHESDLSAVKRAGSTDIEESYEESTKEPFSRPPSREGGPISRPPNKQHDPDILSYLRKYEEVDDVDDIVACSEKSMSMAQEALECAKELDEIADEAISKAASDNFELSKVIESNPPNIRISENPDTLQKRKRSDSLLPTHHDEAEFPSQGSSDQSTSRSIPTGSSKGSDSRRVIAPHTVSHLIPEQLAGMIFDRERNMWLKGKAARVGSKDREISLAEETEEDPFNGIPDLSVDEAKEVVKARSTTTQFKEHAKTRQGHEQEDHSPSNSTDGKEYIHDRKSTLDYKLKESVENNNHDECVVKAEQEIPIHEDRVSDASPNRRRNVTITFSSPIASVMESTYCDDDSSESLVRQGLGKEEFHAVDEKLVIKKRTSKQKQISSKGRGLRSISRNLSYGIHRFQARPVSRIDEKDEDEDQETDDQQHRRSLSLAISEAPRSPPRHASSLILATPRPSREIGTLELTPLSDFTVHQANESFGLEVSYIVGGQRHVLGNGSQRTLSLSIRDLVQKITEIEPFEPDWEYLKHMDLEDKRLTNLHKLNEFCGSLEELNVSNNQISQLDGAPSTLRHLRITNNYVSDLAAWGHLSNLQYVDVSNNKLETLSAFRYLVHLRGLRADNNKIKSIEGIHRLDALLSLRLRGNSLTSVDFDTAKLQRLTELDLADNQITSIQNIHNLRSLTSLNLDDNKISDFSRAASESARSLKYLKLSGNDLESFHVGNYPNLRLLYLDRNRLVTITGLLKTKYLDSLSMREQKDDAALDLSFLNEAFEVRKLFLSGNYLGAFDVNTPFLNLQYLELASCGIDALSLDFGRLFPNLRILNLNFNALRNIYPLYGILRLKKIYLVGNRLERLRQNIHAFGHFRNLTLVDLRNNPLTIGFYSPNLEKRLAVQNTNFDEMGATNSSDPFILGAADKTRDAKFSSCLDMETRMTRRVYEVLVMIGCPRLKMLDGLKLERSLINTHDKVYGALAKNGFVEDSLPDIKTAVGGNAGNENEEVRTKFQVEQGSEEGTTKKSGNVNVPENQVVKESGLENKTKTEMLQEPQLVNINNSHTLIDVEKVTKKAVTKLTAKEVESLSHDKITHLQVKDVSHQDLTEFLENDVELQSFTSVYDDDRWQAEDSFA